MWGQFDQSTFRSQQQSVIETQKALLSNQYRNKLRQSLNKYYRSNSYIANVSVDLSNKYQPDTTILNEIVRLPGLPTLPDEIRQNPYSENGPFVVNNMVIEILLDTSFTQQDVEFIENIARLVTSLNEFRGDELIIDRRIFPVKRFWNEGKNYQQTVDSTKIALDELRKELLEQREIDQAKQEKPEKQTPQEMAFEHFLALMPYILLGLFSLLAIWLLLRVFYRRQKTENQSGNSENPNATKDGGVNLSPVLKDLEEIKSKMSNRQSRQEQIASQGLKSFVVSSFVGNSKQSQRVLSDWMIKDEKKGISDVATLMSGVDERLLEVLSSEMDSDLVADIQREMQKNAAKNIGEEDIRPILQQFQTDYRTKGRVIKESAEQDDLFGFLKNLNQEQVLHLVKNEDAGIGAVIVAQLNPSIATGVLRRLDEGERNRIFGEMGKIENLSVSGYRQIASEIAKKAMPIFNMKYVAVDGAEKIVNILEGLSISEQEKYLNNLNQTDLDLAQKVRKRFITWDKLPSLPEDLLRSVIPNLDRNTIVLATFETSGPVYDTIFEYLPNRMKLVVESEHGSGSEFKAKEIEKARREIITVLTTQVRSLNIDISGDDATENISLNEQE